MGNQNNTLEGHLNSFKDPKATKLAAAWTINKAKLTGVLSLITAAFPTYSLHDASHSETIVENIERLLGNKISKLGATDTFMLLMAAYTHDLGMYLSYKVIEDKWKTTDFAKRIKELENNHDPQIAKAAKLLRETQDKVNNPAAARKDDDDTMCWALEVKNAVTLLTIELFRGEHAKRSENYLNDDNEFARLLGDIDQYGGMRATLAKIAYLHYEDFSKVFILEKEAKGFAGTTDVCHPRFVACMIRLGDLLDFDNNRFNSFAMAMVKEVPETSLVHYKKHYSTGGELSNISSTEIRVTFDCDKDDVYREAAKWKKMVEEELFNMHAYWSEIAPEESSGKLMIRLPSAKQIKIKLKYNGKENPNPALMNLRFDISSKKTFEMLKGGAIYKEPGRVFLREIVQNALDATKLQIWQDMDIHLPFDLENPKRHIGTREDIRFFSDIPASVYNKYPVSLNVDYDKKTQSIIVTCEDCGTGISDESLIRMTSQVGESRKADKDYEKTIKAMPYFLQPTAVFGLGLQTVFYVTDKFTVETRCPSEKARRIVFRTSTNGNYCSIVDEDIEFQRTVAGTDQKRDVPHGTTVKIVIDKEHLGRLFELDEKKFKELINSPAFIGYHIPSIDEFARETFMSIDDIPFRYHSPYNSFETHNSFERIKDQEKYEFLKEEGDFRLYGRLGEYRHLIDRTYSFWLEERKYGSHMKIEFSNWLDDYYYPTEIMLRNIPVTTMRSWWWNTYVDIKWNLCCREADKQVNLSRDGLLPQGESWCLETMNELLPACIQLTHKFLLERYQNSEGDVKDYLLNQYGNLCLLNWHLPQPMEVDLAPLKEHFIPLAKDNDGNPVNTKQVIESKGLVVVRCSSKHFRKTIIKNSSKIYKISYEVIISYKYFQDNELIINNEVSIPDAYLCSEIFFVQDQHNGNSPCYRLVKENPSDGLQWVTISNDDIIIYVIDGDCIHAFKNYEEIVVSKDAPILGFDPPFHGKCWIYPVRDFLEIQYTLPNNRTKAETFLREKGRMEKMVPDHIVELIQKYNVLKNKNLSKEEIHNAYIRLILDNKFGFEEPSEQKK